LDINKVKSKSRAILNICKDGDKITGNDSDFLKDLIELHDKKDQKMVIACAIHCCCNGPFGVNKLTTVSGKSVCLKDIAPNLTNRVWKNFCRIAAEHIKKAYPSLECQTRNLLGDLWPIKDWTTK